MRPIGRYNQRLGADKMAVAFMISSILLSIVAIAIWVRSFDTIVARMSNLRPDLWTSFGRPPGFFTVPPGSSWARGFIARQHLVSVLSFSQPGWIREDFEFCRAWRRMLLAGLLYVLVFFPLLIVGLIME